MEENRILKKNIVMNTILSFITLIYPLIIFPYVSRVLLPNGIGKVNFAISIITYFSMFAQLGIPLYGIRICSELRDDKLKLTKVVFEIFIIYSITTCIIFFIYLLCVFNVEKFFVEKKLYLVISFTFFFNLIGFEWFLKSLEEYTLIVKTSVLFRIISLIFILILVKDKTDYVKYAFLTIFVTSGTSLFYVLKLKNYIKLKSIKLKMLNLSRHLKPIFTFFLMSVTITLYTNLDTVMLGFLSTEEQVGFYTTALKIKNILVTLITSFGTVLLPRLSYYITQKREEEYKKIIKKSFNYILIVAIPLAFYFILFAKTTIAILAGEKYINSIVPMQVLMPTVICIGITNLIGIQIMLPLHQEKKLLVTVMSGAVVDLIINLLLIPKLLALASAVATLAAEIVVLILQVLIMRRMIKSIVDKKGIFQILVSSIISGILSSCIKLLSFNNITEFFLSGIIFIITFVILLLIFKNPLIYEILEIRKKWLKN
ncbi:Capsular polysaccharide repeat unit transport protein CpsM [Fusobacterium vincentii ATCC 49256]|uniref:Capsular polysaccharide repeat unit transport protein CpsM n=1 Tax=Fusobacterium vincentii ATCC 49256 TaxID=209882 RepID=Q7P741_FUSVC|nr:flippase [Fusobacterium sp. HMSC064B12]EAA24622.1 Capsular polysaccharide repeat unit transport protein CpsM [Fusobacterium vincentii ATCC 49256]